MIQKILVGLFFENSSLRICFSHFIFISLHYTDESCENIILGLESWSLFPFSLDYNKHQYKNRGRSQMR